MGSAIIHPLPFETDLLGLHQLNPARYPCLLESITANPGLARYDLLFAEPQEELLLDGAGELTLDGKSLDGESDFLKVFDSWWQQEKCPHDGGEWPFQGGWVVFLGYELLHQIEPSVPSPTTCASNQPIASARRVPVALMRDRLLGRCVVLAEPGQEALVAQIKADLAALESQLGSRFGEVPDPVGALTEDPVEQFLSGVGRIQRYIHEGDVFQVNLSRAWRWSDVEISSAELYSALRDSNPAPFAGLWIREDHAVVSSSPERLVEVRGGRISSRPIAGTRPRSGEPEQDRLLQQELLEHPKERAEHIMLIDLERNDIGRVAKPGSVVVDELMGLESYAHVHHIVSNVCGQLRDNVGPGEVLRAMFPGGTITGCPKVRCMQIISELEGEPRGAYTGSIGYINRNGDMDFNILIRSFEYHSSELKLRTGAGVVADSDPQRELAETQVKAQGLLAALGIAD